MSLAYRAGVEAYADGFARNTLPFDRHTEEAADWLAGWDWAYRNEWR